MGPGSLHTIVGLKHRWSMRHMRVKTQGFNALNLATFGLMLMTLMTILLFRSCFGDAVQFGQYFFQQPPYLIIILGVTWLNLFRAGDATVSPVGVRDICVLELQPCTCTRSVRLLDSTALIEVFCLRRPLLNSVDRLVTVGARLVRPVDFHANVIGLVLESSVSLAPSWPRWRRATFSSSSLGNKYTWFWYLDWVLSLPASSYALRSSSCASVWFVNELDMTKDGWPVAQPRLRRRPSARTMTPWPSGKVYLSHCGLMFIRVVAFSSYSIWISLSKWPMLPTMALFFIFFMCSRVMMSLLPVVVMKTSASEIRSSIVTTWYPSMHACSAQIGSISVTYVIAFCAH